MNCVQFSSVRCGNSFYHIREKDMDVVTGWFLRLCTRIKAHVKQVCALHIGLNGWTSTAQKMSVGDKDRKNAAPSPAKIICSVKKANNWGKIYCSIRGIKAGCKIVPRGRPEELSAQATLQVALQIAEPLKCFGFVMDVYSLDLQ